MALFQERLSLLPDLLRRFKDVDDLYVSERLYAVAYGCVMRAAHDAGRWDEIATVAQTVFDLVFADGDPPPHILLRDYARGVVERALDLDLDVDVEAEKSSSAVFLAVAR